MKDAMSAGKARQNPRTRCSLYEINEHFEDDFKAVSPSSIVFQRPGKDTGYVYELGNLNSTRKRFYWFPLTCLVWIGLAIFLTVAVCSAGEQQSRSGSIPLALVYFSGGKVQPVTSHVMLVDKSKQKLLVYAYNKNGIRKVGTFACSTGKVRGAKRRSGDQKTPEGIYFFVKKHYKKDLAPIYGDLAFPMDYPNQIDRLAGRSGYAIWLHGTNKSLKPRDSNGCVVVENSTINKLAEIIRLNRTPIIITGKVKYRPEDQPDEDLPDVMALLEKWRRYLVRGSYGQYRGLYSNGRGPSMRWWTQWCDLRKIPGDGHRYVDISITGLEVYKQAGVFCVTFNQVLTYKGAKLSVGRKKLFLVKQKAAIQILAESYQRTENNTKSRRDKLFAAMEKISNGY